MYRRGPNQQNEKHECTALRPDWCAGLLQPGLRRRKATAKILGSARLGVPQS